MLIKKKLNIFYEPVETLMFVIYYKYKYYQTYNFQNNFCSYIFKNTERTF